MRRIPYVLVLFLLPAFRVLASPQAMNLKDVPDDARATIAKELARKNTQQQALGEGASTDPDDSGSAKQKGGCTMDVGSQNQRSPAQRRTITVVSGPIVQICK